MNIAVVGTGYVGLVSGACFAEMGAEVTCVDIDAAKIERLRNGEIPIYEPELTGIVRRNVAAGRLRFATELASCIGQVEVVFIAVGTPPDEDGSADVKNVLAVARVFGANINKYTLLVTKSTVPVGTARKVKETVLEELEKRGVSIPFDVAANPEFLKEGAAVKDFMSPDRVVVGVDSDRAKEVMSRLYQPFLLKSFRVIFTDIASAEMINYAANSMLATRISFMNEIANLCERVGADVNLVRQGIGADTRIGNNFLYPGCGYGGSCFPKDVRALVRTAEKNGCEMKVLKAVEEVNTEQKKLLFKKLNARYPEGLADLTIALWGLSFIPETDDMREATSLVTSDLLRAAGCRIRVFDPVAMNECRRRYGDVLEYADDMYEAVAGADALLLHTEWKQFRMPDWKRIRSLMRIPLVIDGRNIYDPVEMAEYGFEYSGIGR